jgi:FAD/FMN-containing dehydrogenase
VREGNQRTRGHTASGDRSGLRCGDVGRSKRPFDEALVADGVIAESGTQAKELWHIREAIVEAQNYSGSIKHDVLVPVSRAAEFIIRATAGVTETLPSIRPMAFGHVGDGNIHLNLTQPERADTEAYLARWQEFNDIVHGVVRELQGSISVERGVGMMKRGEITHHKSPVEIELMRRLKRAFDPANIMNPGKVVSV